MSNCIVFNLTESEHQNQTAGLSNVANCIKIFLSNQTAANAGLFMCEVMRPCQFSI